MLEDLKKAIDKGIDYAFMTTEKVTKAAKEMARENNLTKEEGKKLLDYLEKKTKEARNTLEDTIQEAIKNYLKKMDVPTREDFETLDKRIKKLEGTKKPAAKKTPRKTTAKKPAAKKATPKKQ